MSSLSNKIGYDKKELNIYIILLSAPVLLSVYWYYCQSNFFATAFTEWASDPMFDFWSHILQFVCFFVLVFIIPAIFVKTNLKQKLGDFGIGLGDKKLGFIISAIFVPLLAGSLYFLTNDPKIIAEYPLAKILHEKPDLVLWYELSYIIFYYIAWEFYFRGFLLFGLEKRFGGFNAILIQTISSCLIHIGKPDGETLGSIVFGVALGILALRTRSIWYGFLIHITLGVMTDLYVLYVH